MENQPISRGRLFLRAVITLGAFLAIMFFIIIAIAGTLNYWQAWVYLVTLIVPMIFVLIYLLRYNPQLLARRMQFHEKEAPQKKIIKFGTLLYVFIYLVPALDQRLAWSEIPAVVSLVADGFVLLGYSLFVLVIRYNSYASRTIEVVEGQELISTGPYAFVRHPMYVGNILLYIATPVALGSWWGLIPVVIFIPIMIYRIYNEEMVLLRDLAGYEQYMHKVRHRLLPGIW